MQKSNFYFHDNKFKHKILILRTGKNYDYKTSVLL